MNSLTHPEGTVKMNVKALVMDPVSNMPVVILQEPDANAYLPIWIGVCEANSIALELEKIQTPRPMTHDLISSLIETMGFAVEHIYIHSLSDSVFHAAIHLRGADGSRREVDSRPSDALAIALRAHAEVLVAREVVDQAVVAEGSQEEALKAILEKLRPEDFGEYEM